MSRGENRKPDRQAPNRSISIAAAIGHNLPLEPIDPAPPTYEQLLTPAQVATILNVSLRSVRRLIAKGDIAVAHVGRAIRVHPKAIRKLVDQC